MAARRQTTKEDRKIRRELVRECQQQEHASQLYKFVRDITQMQGYYCIAQIELKGEKNV
jgi:hypothetical protein